MANHTDFDDEIAETWEALHGSNYGEDVEINYGSVTWKHRAFMNKITKNKKTVTEEVNGESELNEVHEYFRANIDMPQSFRMNAKNFKTKATIELPPKYRFPKVEHGRFDYHQGTPEKLVFPHTGTTSIIEESKMPLPSNGSTDRSEISFVHTTVKADIRICTYFDGDVIIKQGYSRDSAGINELLESANLEHFKTDSHGNRYFESNGSVTIEIRRSQNPA